MFGTHNNMWGFEQKDCGVSAFMHILYLLWSANHGTFCWRLTPRHPETPHMLLEALWIRLHLPSPIYLPLNIVTSSVP